MPLRSAPGYRSVNNPTPSRNTVLSPHGVYAKPNRGWETTFSIGNDTLQPSLKGLVVWDISSVWQIVERCNGQAGAIVLARPTRISIRSQSERQFELRTGPELILEIQAHAVKSNRLDGALGEVIVCSDRNLIVR